MRLNKITYIFTQPTQASHYKRSPKERERGREKEIDRQRETWVTEREGRGEDRRRYREGKGNDRSTVPFLLLLPQVTWAHILVHWNCCERRFTVHIAQNFRSTITIHVIMHCVILRAPVI